MEAIRHDTRCRLCGSESITTVMRLEPTPPEDKFVGPAALNQPQDVYPLELAICESCGYLHLPHILNPKLSYADYLYVSQVTLGLGTHYDSYAEEVLNLIRPSADSLVVDLGSNDGTMLAGFKKRGMKVLGVEPATSIAMAATEAGIPTIAGFFTDDIVGQITKERGKAKIVTANYMYANIDDLHGFTESVVKLLDRDGVFVVQTGYHPDQMKILMFDYIYHEHFSYFSVKVLQQFFARHELEIFDAHKTPAKGGSIRLFIQHSKGSREISSNVKHIIAQEELEGIHSASKYIEFAGKIDEKRKVLHDFISDFTTQKKRVVGYGASHSTTTFTYHFQLGQCLEYIVDDNPLKHGLYSPGYHIPVYASPKLLEDMPDYVVILAWQYADAIIRRTQEYVSKGGKIIVPLPNFKLVQ